tara:strand:+ start:763 stop:1827 length:1065 start_codon:yes stop_codon:yes gene_type:complete
MSQEIKLIKVLAIEDDQFITMIYEQYFQNNEHIIYELQVKSTLYEGLKELFANKYDIVLLDLNLPDSKSEETISQIPLIAYSQPVIVMTSETDESVVLKTMNLGSQDYLVKSELDKKGFLRSIGFAIERHGLKAEIIKEKERSDNLLQSILPIKIAEELKADGITKARYYDDVSVMFIDFENFTKLTSNFTPYELVNELHICFCAFDEIMMKYELEKIKTIGDSYMCAGNIPEEIVDHTAKICLAAIDIQKFIHDRQQVKRMANEPFWNARIGIHVGPVVAGVVGSKKFVYDIWGDTVNIASRIEKHGAGGKIAISEALYDKLKEDVRFQFESKGEQKMKGLGLTASYFIEKSN